MVFLTFFHRVFFFLIALARSLEIQGGKLGLRHFTLGTDSLMVEVTRSHQNSQCVSSSSWDLIVFIPQPRGNNVKLLFTHLLCTQKVRQNKLGENGYCRNYFIKKSFCHTFPVIPKAQNYRECMETKKKQYLGIPKNGYQI